MSSDRPPEPDADDWMARCRDLARHSVAASSRSVSPRSSIPLIWIIAADVHRRGHRIVRPGRRHPHRPPYPAIWWAGCSGGAESRSSGPWPASPMRRGAPGALRRRAGRRPCRSRCSQTWPSHRSPASSASSSRSCSRMVGLPSPRWRPVAWFGLFSTALAHGSHRLHARTPSRAGSRTRSGSTPSPAIGGAGTVAVVGLRRGDGPGPVLGGLAVSTCRCRPAAAAPVVRLRDSRHARLPRSSASAERSTGPGSS